MAFADILEEHLEEADFLWQQRVSALSDRQYNLHRLAEMEERVLAHLDGLVLGGEEVWKLIEQKLTDGDRSEAFVAASVALESEDDGVAALVCDRLGTAPPSIRSGIQEAFDHASHARIEPMLRKFLQSERSAKKSTAIDILSFRRVSVDRNELRVSLRDHNKEVLRASLVAIARLKMTQLENDIRPLLRSDNMSLRQDAIRTGLMVGIDSALDEARQIVQEAPDQAGEMLILLGNAGQPKDLPLLIDAVNERAQARNAVTAIGLLGYSDAMPCLLETIGDSGLARLAGEAIQLITGVDLEEEGLAAVAPALQPQDGDDDLADDPDDDLLWPDPQAIGAWWRELTLRFDRGVRYRYGDPYSTPVLVDSLAHANLRHRHYAAFELALSGRSLPYLETRAFARVQRMQIAKLNPA